MPVTVNRAVNYRVVTGIILVFLLLVFLQGHSRQTNIGWVNTALATANQPGLSTTVPPSPASTTLKGSGTERRESSHAEPFSIVLTEELDAETRRTLSHINYFNAVYDAVFLLFPSSASRGHLVSLSRAPKRRRNPMDTSLLAGHTPSRSV